MRRNFMPIFEAQQPRWTTRKKRGSMTKQKKRVFNQENRVNVDLSSTEYIFYDISHDEIQFSIYSHHREL